MSDNFKAVYRILSYLKKSERCDEFDGGQFTAEHFGLTARQWALTLERLTDDGHVKGVCIRYSVDGYPSIGFTPEPRITSKGLEYLEENSFMRKAASLAKGIVEIYHG